MERRTSASSGALQGEDLTTTHSADARHWISIYADLLEFKRGLLARVHRDLPKLRKEAQEAARVDVGLIEMQMLGYEARLELWYRRVWELQGLWVNPETRVIKYREREAVLTRREFELMQMMLEHHIDGSQRAKSSAQRGPTPVCRPKKRGITCSACARFFMNWTHPWISSTNRAGATRWSFAWTEVVLPAVWGPDLLWPLF